jgi:hypothetical protein
MICGKNTALEIEYPTAFNSVTWEPAIGAGAVRVQVRKKRGGNENRIAGSEGAVVSQRPAAGELRWIEQQTGVWQGALEGAAGDEVVILGQDVSRRVGRDKEEYEE